MSEPCDMVWSSERTTPAEVEAALRAMLVERHAEHAGCIPARTLNLVCVVDARSRAEIAERLRHVGPHVASRTIVCAIETQRTDIGAVARISSDLHPRPGEFAVLRETVILAVGERHLPHLEAVVDPLVVSDLPTVVWSPSDHDDAVHALLGLSQVVLVDSIEPPVPGTAMRRARGLLERAQVIDLAWLRSAPWRERLAATFDPAPLRPELDRIHAVAIRHHPGSAVTGLLLAGWLASRLGWRARPLQRRGQALAGSAPAHSHDVRITLEPRRRQRVKGLAGLTLETTSGSRLSLDRAPGGLYAHLREPTAEERSWTLLGASRGEGGILGEGIRQALIHDGLYGPALAAASTFAAEL